MLSMTPQKPYSVSELTGNIRDLLERGFPILWVEGEISNVRVPASGHIYFTLKDPSTQIRAVLFKKSAKALRFTLQDGFQAIVRGRLTVYEPRGEYQLILDHLEPKGVGALQIAFEQLKEKLAHEGLFDPARKRPLPFLPQKVGIATSLSGAAIRDMLSIIERRCPLIRVVIAPVPVQGQGAAQAIAEAIQALGTVRGLEVIIVGRGGGSMEDLWCFNEEIVVRTVATSPVPVVSAVGHEIDYTLTDFAADYRAPTPSAAAEIVTPIQDNLIFHIREYQRRLRHAIKQQLNLLQHRVYCSRNAIPPPSLWFSRQSQQIDDLVSQIQKAVTTSFAQFRPHLMNLESRLHVHSPHIRIQRALVLAQQLLKRLRHNALMLHTSKCQIVRSLTESLNNLSPLAILSRGYSILETLPSGHILQNVRSVKPGDHIRARLSDGQLLCTVEESRPET